jgi:antitoxin YefM
MNPLSGTLPANEARSNFYQMLDEVGNNLRRFVITHRGKTRAIVMPIEDVEAWEETLEILSDKRLMKDIKKSKADFKAGRFSTLDEIEKKYKLS